MSLQVWLPLNGDLENKGLKNVTVTNNGVIIDDNGKIGKCYSFGSTVGKYINIENTAMNTFTTEASVCFWLNILTWNVNYSTYFQAGTNNISWKDYVFGLLRNNNTSKCCFTISDGTTASSNSYLTPDLELNKWYHISLVYKTGHCLIYINGQLYQDYTTSIIPNFQSISRISLGIGNNRSSYQSNCKLNDVRIYDHALSIKEIKQISKGLVLHYPLDRNGFGQDNLLLNTPKSANPSSYNFAQFNLVPNLQANKTYTLQLWDVNVSHTGKTESQIGVSVYWGGGSISLARWTGTTYFTNGHADYLVKTFTVTEAQANHSNAVNAWLNIYNSVPDASGTRNGSIGKWKLEENNVATSWSPNVNDIDYTILGLNDTTLYDYSGYQNNSTLNGTLSYNIDTPKYEISSQFNGTSSNIQGVFFTSQVKTVSFWICFNNLNNQVVFTDYKSRMAFGIYNSHIPVSCTNNGYTTTYNKSLLSINTWYHVVLVKDQINNQILLYLNGIKQNKGTTTDRWVSNIFDELRIGVRGNNTTFFNGKLSDFRMYVTAFSEEDVKELYKVSVSIDRDANFYTYQYKEIQNEKFSTKSNNIVNSYQIQQKFYNLGLITTSSSIASFPDGADNVPMEDVKVNIDPVQDLHGYDNPWPAGGGKNLLENNVQNGTHSSGVTVTRNNDGSLTLNGTVTKSTVIIGNLATGVYGATTSQNDEKKHIPIGEYVISTGLSSNIGAYLQVYGTNRSGTTELNMIKSAATSDTLIIDDTYLYNWVRILLNAGEYNNIVIKPMLCLASETDTSYSPYENICPITGWTGVNVQRTGKNLLNPNIIEIGSYDPSGLETQGGNNTYRRFKLTLPEGNYVFSTDLEDCYFIRVLINNVVVWASRTTQSYSFTLSETSELKIAFRNTSSTAITQSFNCMIESGSIATDYEPYAGNLYPITFPTEAGTVYGGTLDVTTGVLTVDRAITLVTGSSSLAKDSDQAGYHRFYMAKNDVEKRTDYIGHIIANACPTVRNYAYFGTFDGEMAVTAYSIKSNPSNYLYIISKSLSTVAEVQAQFAEEPLQIVYELATPITYQLTPTEIRSLLGTNNVFADTGDIKNLIYYKNNNTISIQRNGIIQANSFIEI